MRNIWAQECNLRQVLARNMYPYRDTTPVPKIFGLQTRMPVAYPAEGSGRCHARCMEVEVDQLPVFKVHTSPASLYQPTSLY